MKDSLKPGEAHLQASPTSIVYRGNSLVMLAAMAIVGAFLTCGWYVQTQLADMRMEQRERDAVIRSELTEIRTALLWVLRRDPINNDLTVRPPKSP